MNLPSNKLNSQNNEIIRFKLLAERYQQIAADSGIKLNTFRSSEMPYLSKASPEEIRNATYFLESVVSIHEETIAANEKPVNSRQLLWRALRKLSLIPKPEIFDLIKENDVVVIYDESQKAVFWNLQFFNYASLTVEELFFGHWFTFTKRDQAIHNKLYEMAVNIITGKITGIFSPDVPAHEVEEVDTIECIRTLMEIPHGCVLTKNGQLGGILIVQTMKII